MHGKRRRRWNIHTAVAADHFREIVSSIWLVLDKADVVYCPGWCRLESNLSKKVLPTSELPHIRLLPAFNSILDWVFLASQANIRPGYVVEYTQVAIYASARLLNVSKCHSIVWRKTLTPTCNTGNEIGFALEPCGDVRQWHSLSLPKSLKSYIFKSLIWFPSL